MHEGNPFLVLGIAGKVGSGKDTVADLLQLQYGLRSVNLSELVYESNLQLQINPTREQQRTLATSRRQQDGAYWVRYAYNRVVKDLPAPGITLVSLYCEDEVDYLKRSLGGKLLVVRCDDLAIRYERYVRRYNDDPRRLLQEHEFEILDRREKFSENRFEPNVDQVITMADLVVDNTSTKEELSNQLKDVLQPFGLTPQNSLIPTEEVSELPDTLFFVKRLERRYSAVTFFREYVGLKHLPQMSEQDRALASLTSPVHSVHHVSDEFAVRLLDEILSARSLEEAFSRYKLFPYHTTDEELALLLNETQFRIFFEGLHSSLDANKKKIHRAAIENLRGIVEADEKQFRVEEGRSLDRMLTSGLSFNLPPTDEVLELWNDALRICGDGPTPVTEVLKNLRLVEVNGLEKSKISLVIHDAIDHLWFIHTLNEHGFFKRYSRLFRSIGNPVVTDIYKRESEAIASISFGVRSWTNFQVGYVPAWSIHDISALFDEHLENRRLDESHNEAHRIIRRLARDPLSRESQSLSFVYSNYRTELDEQRRRYGSIKFRNLETNRVEGELDPASPDYLSFFVEAHHLIVGSVEKRIDGRSRVKHRDTLLRMHLEFENLLANKDLAQPGKGIRWTIFPQNLEELDVSRLQLSPERIRWISHNFGFTAVRESIV
jgi:dephospho-CoA kinase